MQKRKIAIITGTRAEYGLLYWLMKEISEDAQLQLQIIVTGMHLSHEFGLTYKLIEKDGFVIDEKIEMLLSSDSAVGVAKSTGLATISLTDALQRLSPDIVVVLGDRFEILAAVQAAMLLKIPVAHIHGGELTEGVLDESIRHANTKMSHLHFPVAEVYRNRVIQMGEQPSRVFNFGAPGLDHIVRSKLLEKSELENLLQIELSKQNILVTYRPVTLKREASHEGLYTLLQALDQFPEATIIFTKSNADEGGRKIGDIIDDYLKNKPSNRYAFISLGLIKYLSLAKVVDVVVGNSSSGLIEVPFVETATVNIGNRQNGRLRASSVIDCNEGVDDIVSAINKAFSEKFQASLENIVSPYGRGDASVKIKDVLKSIDLKDLVVKRFYDLKINAQQSSAETVDCQTV